MRPNYHISPMAKSRMNKKIDYIVDTTPEKWLFSKEMNKHYKFQLGFLTLTLPGSQLTDFGSKLLKKFCHNKFCRPNFTDIPGVLKYSDNYIKEFLLNQFLTELRTRWNTDVYMWKAEAQENGNIHFHLIINKFIYHDYLRKCWNRICNKLGMIDDFNQVWNHRNPNSIDVHMIRKIKKLKKYFSKYMTKASEMRRKINGKIWGCSQSVSDFKGITIELEGKKAIEFRQFFSYFKNVCFGSDFFNSYRIGIAQMEVSHLFPTIVNELRQLFAEKYGIIVNPEESYISSN
jgi:hypothetical protein